MVAWRAFALDTRSLAVFRMAIGAIVCADAMLRTRDLALMFAPDGMFPLDVLARYHSGPGIWSAATFVDASWWGAVMLAIEAAAGLLLAVGGATRWTTIIAWVVIVSVIRRTAPAANAGDYWLATLLLWSMFLPLGARWSLDAWRADRSSAPADHATLGASPGSVALVLQIVAVYLSAGLAKWNESWWSGDAVAYALSVHDHGTRLGEMVASLPWLARGLTWGTLGMELMAPAVVLLAPSPAVRAGIVLMFILFHLVICGTMTVGLFGYVGMAAWLALIPSACWQWAGMPAAVPESIEAAASRRSRWLCAACGGIAAVAFVHDNTAWRAHHLPRPLETAVNALCLHQTWGMFGSVPRQHQWVYTRAELADGRIVDVLRGGRPMEDMRPTDGFLSLPHHRWHKLFWELPRPAQRIFAPAVAAALTRDWNARHTATDRVVSLEIRFARLGTTPTDETLHELLLGSWPCRDTTGTGNLDRLLRDGAEDRID